MLIDYQRITASEVAKGETRQSHRDLLRQASKEALAEFLLDLGAEDECRLGLDGGDESPDEPSGS